MTGNEIALTGCLIIACLFAVGFAWSSFEYFCRLKELQAKYDKLKAEKELPPLYNEYADFPGEQIPLGQISNREYRMLREKTKVDEIHIAQGIIDDIDAVHRFTLYLDTSAGCFVRTIEADAKMSLETERDFHLHLNWFPIHAGKNLTIFEGVITYGGIAMGRIADGERSLYLQKGDQLRVDYTFTT